MLDMYKHQFRQVEGVGLGVEVMKRQKNNAVGAALGSIPAGLFLLTARNEHHRGGILTTWVQRVCVHPAMVSVAVAKGQPIMALISETRYFALCRLRGDDRAILNKFAHAEDEGEDPFLSFEMLPNRPTGLPIPAQVAAFLECALAFHIDVEGDHDLFVANVVGGDLIDDEGVAPATGKVGENSGWSA